MARFNYYRPSTGVYGHKNGVYTDEAPYPKIIDDFEDGDISEYAGDTGGNKIVTSPVYNGTYAVGGTGATFKAITDTNELTHPSQGETFEFYFRGEAIQYSYGSILFAVQSETGNSNLSAYEVKGEADGLFINIWQNGSQNGLSTFNGSLSNNTWYRIETTWKTDGTISAACYKVADGSTVATASATDTTFTSGGIGWMQHDQGHAYSMDYARITA